MVCSNCGADIQSAANFCTKCSKEEEPSHESKIRAFDIDELLQEKYAFLTGGKDHNNLIVTIPGDSEIRRVADEDVEKVFKYLLSLPRPESVAQKFTIVLDRRSKSWKSVNIVLTKIKNTFPSPVNRIFVLKPEGHKRFVGSLSCEEAQAAFQIVTLEKVADLQKYIDQDQLSTDLGGNLEYEHKQWLGNRSAIDGIECKVADITKRLDELRGKCERTFSVQLMQEKEFTLELMEEIWQNIQEDIMNTRITGDILLKCFHPNRNKDDEANTTELEGLLKKLNDSEITFADFRIAWRTLQDDLNGRLWRICDPGNQDAVYAEDAEDRTDPKTKQIMMELVATERDYVADLRCIILGYIREFEKVSDKIPPNLYDKKNIIFGNIEQIYEFHNEEFLRELEKCVDDPLLVGEVFHEKKDEFEMYAKYCNNKPASEALQQDFINLPFVKECQSKLGHKLPLSAYLLKPVQRITKYQLLLKEMIKNTPEDRNAKLMEALQSMQSVLRHLNDVMHSRLLRGYQDLDELGKLVLQNSFLVWHMNTRRGIPSLRGRLKQVFLYEKMVIFTRRKKNPNGEADHIYQYENSLKLSEIGITEDFKHDHRKFKLCLYRRPEVYTFQAESQEEKELWVVKLRELLQRQFDQAKEEQKLRYEEFWKQKSKSTTNLLQQNPTNSSKCLTKSLSRLPSDQDSDKLDRDDSYEQHTSEGSSVQPPKVVEHGSMYTVLKEYRAVGLKGITLTPGQKVEVLRIVNGGWWQARNIESQQDGWVPASYLEPIEPSQ